jgi:hypothetical protein
VASGKLFATEDTASTPAYQPPAAAPAPEAFSEEVMTIHLESGGTKAVKISSLMTGEDLVKAMASKMNLDAKYAAYLTAYEVKRGREKLIGSGSLCPARCFSLELDL